MSAPMTARYAATLQSREQIHGFVEDIRKQGIKVIDGNDLLDAELTPGRFSELIDRYFGLDRALLDAERAAALQPGAECACDP